MSYLRIAHQSTMGAKQPSIQHVRRCLRQLGLLEHWIVNAGTPEQRTICASQHKRLRHYLVEVMRREVQS